MKRILPFMQSPKIPGFSREARDASFMCGRICAMRKRLTCPRILEARKEICREARLWQPVVSCHVESHQFATVIQATYNIERFHSAMSHGRDQEFLFPFGAESKNWSKILPMSCLNLFKAVGECAGVGGSSTTGREAESMKTQASRVQDRTQSQRIISWWEWHCTGLQYGPHL